MSKQRYCPDCGQKYTLHNPRCKMPTAKRLEREALEAAKQKPEEPNLFIKLINKIKEIF